MLTWYDLQNAIVTILSDIIPIVGSDVFNEGMGVACPLSIFKKCKKVEVMTVFSVAFFLVIVVAQMVKMPALMKVSQQISGCGAIKSLKMTLVTPLQPF